MFESAPESASIRALRPTLRYLMQTEVHVYAFAVAASVLLSFVPFLIVILSLCRHVFKWPAAVDAIHLALSDYFPGPLADFVQRNVDIAVERGAFQVTSILLLLLVANGVFEPLEVALNRAWGAPGNRSYWRNQLISLGLIFICGALALLSTTFTALSFSILPRSQMMDNVGRLFFKMAAIPLSMFMLFLIYWLLPNRKIPWRAVAPAAVVVGLGLEMLKYFNLMTWPLLQAKLAGEYGPFVYSVSIILWSFLAAMLVLAGAEWSSRSKITELHAQTEVDRL